MAYNPFNRSQNNQASAAARFNDNNTGGTLPKGLPVKLSSTGVDLIDVSLESDIDALAGVLSEDAPNVSPASIVTSGTIKNIVTSISVGSAAYLSKVGTLTATKPSIGVAGFAEGDFIVKIGMVGKNTDNPANKDLLVGIQIMGQL